MEWQYLSKEYQKQFWATNKNARGGAVALIYPTTTTVLADVLGVPFQVALVIGFCAASIPFNPATVSNDRLAGSGRFPSGLQPFATNIAGGGDPAAGTGRCRRVAPTPATAAFGDSFDSRLGDQV
jgi:hypothetical protein